MSKSEGISELRSVLQTRHVIPKYQRNYTWSEDQAIDLWTDLVEFHKNRIEGSSSYIFGQIVVYCSSDGNTYVIDGQQRLTTLYIYFAANKFLFNKFEIKSNYTSFLDQMLYDFSSVGESAPYLLVANENIDFYNKLISDYGSIDTPLNRSQNNMKLVFDLFCNEICKYILNMEYYVALSSELTNVEKYTFENEIKKINGSLLDFKVVYFVTNQLVDAHRIFDTVNTRGVKLSNTDLVKNYIFATCYSNDKELRNDDLGLEEKWDSISETLGDKFDIVFKYLLRVRSGLVRDDATMRIVKTTLTTTDDVKQFINDLKIATEIYLSITRGSIMFSSETTNRILKGLRGATDYFLHTPLIMSVYIKAKHENRDCETEIETLIRAIDTLFVRNIFAGDKRSNTIEDLIADQSSKYYNDEITFLTMIDNIYKKCSSDATFKEDILSKNDWNNREAKYILSEMYNRNYPTIVLKGSIDLEHILPKGKVKPQEWGQFTEEEKKDCQYRIGNLVLVKNSINRKIKNKNFLVKKEEYASVEYGILDLESDTILSVDTWNRETISLRSNRLSEDMISTWPLNNQD